MAIERVPSIGIGDRQGTTRRLYHICAHEHIETLGKIIGDDFEHYIDQRADKNGKKFGKWEKRRLPHTCPWCSEEIDWTGVLNGSTQDD